MPKLRAPRLLPHLVIGVAALAIVLVGAPTRVGGSEVPVGYPTPAPLLSGVPTNPPEFNVPPDPNRVSNDTAPWIAPTPTPFHPPDSVIVNGKQLALPPGAMLESGTAEPGPGVDAETFTPYFWGVRKGNSLVTFNGKGFILYEHVLPEDQQDFSPILEQLRQMPGG